MSATRPRISGWVQLKAVFRKEVLQTVRDRRVMFMLIVAPLIQTIAFGYAVDFDVDRVPTVVVDLDRSPESREHARRLLADGTLVRVGDSPSAADAERALLEWKAAAAVVIPKALGSDLLAGRPAEVQVVLDGTDPNRSMMAGAAVSRYFGEVQQDLVQRAALARGARMPGQISVIPKILYNPSLRSPPYTIPAIVGLLLLIVTTIVTAMGMTRERETGTLEQVLVTPIHPFLMLVGKMAPFLFIGLLDVLLVLAGATALFDVPIRGSLLAVFFVSTLYLMTTLGIGLFISSVSNTQQQSFLGGFLFILPAVLLSGAMTPIRAMPDWLANITYLNPVRYYVEAMRGVLLKGASLSELRLQWGALLVFGITIIGVATLRFRKRLG